MMSSAAAAAERNYVDQVAREGDVLLVRTNTLIGKLIRFHLRLHFGPVASNHNALIFVPPGYASLCVLQAEEPFVRAVSLLGYIDRLQHQGAEFLLGRPAWIEHELVNGEHHPPGIIGAWRDEINQCCTGLLGRSYDEADLVKILVDDILHHVPSKLGLIRRNKDAQYCTETLRCWERTEFHPWRPRCLRGVSFWTPWHIEQAVRDGDIEIIAGQGKIIRSLVG